nr:type II 3-dehydroquinate dehydratase [Succinatimonas hippei]
MSKPFILVVNGPNLNLLGTREPQVYGHETLSDLNARLDEVATELNVSIEHFQTMKVPSSIKFKA